MVDTAGLGEDCARGWAVVRMMDNAVSELLEAERNGSSPDDDWVITAVTVAKAVQD